MLVRRLECESFPPQNFYEHRFCMLVRGGLHLLEGGFQVYVF
jgi:hypothetical protein